MAGAAQERLHRELVWLFYQLQSILHPHQPIKYIFWNATVSNPRAINYKWRVPKPEDSKHWDTVKHRALFTRLQSGHTQWKDPSLYKAKQISLLAIVPARVNFI